MRRFSLGCLILLTLMLFVAGSPARAQCSASFHGLATISEIYEQNSSNRFVEVKLLSAGISASDYSGWTLRACRRSNVCSSAISLSSASRSNAWLLLNNVDANFIDLRNGMDVILRDGNGDTIDYVTMNNYQPQRDSTCTPAYDWQHSDPNTNSKNLYRDPDGIGNWVTRSGNSAGSSPGGDNGQPPSGSPLVSVSDATVQQGSPLVFTFSLSAASSLPVSIIYQTLDDTAQYGVDYTFTNGNVTIPAGQTALTIQVPTLTPGGSDTRKLRLQIAQAANASIGGQIGIGTILPGPVQTCLADDFNRGALGGDWVTTVRSGTFTPGIVNNRFRMTEARGNQATAATLQRLFPGANNKIILEFNHYAYGGNGADGVVVVLSDATITPQPGGYGGSLGYAQRTGIDGFAGGWMGIGLDEYGNFSNNNEGRVGRKPGTSGRVIDSVAVRGSGSGQSGYAFVDGTFQLFPGIDQGGSTPAPNHRYRITLDSRTPGQAVLTVERDTTGSGNNYATLVGPVDMLARAGQAVVPDNFYLSFTGSTGGSTNIHEFDNVGVCADQINPVSPLIDHFELSYANPALTCEPQDVLVRACLDASCNTLYTDPVTVTLSPGGWIGGNTKTFSGGSATYEYQRTVTGSVNLGVAASTPSTQPFSQTLCQRNGGSLSTQCSLTFVDSGFAFDVPDLIASRPSGTVKLRAVRQSDTSQACVPAFANVTREVNVYSTYINPGPASRPASLPVVVNGSNVGLTSGAATALNLTFDASGEADISVLYRDAGLMQLNARYDGTAGNGDAGLILAGSDQFSSRPAGLCLSTTANCSAGDSSCPVFVAAGRPFNLTSRAVGWESDSDTDLCSGAHDATPNYTQSSIPLSLELVSPSGGTAGVIAPLAFDQARSASAEARTEVSLSEVGVFRIIASPPSYLGQVIPVARSPNVGRVTPDYFALSIISDGVLGAGCTSASPFSYSGEPIPWLAVPEVEISARAFGGGLASNYTLSGYQRLSSGNINVVAPSADSTTPGTDGNLLSFAVSSQTPSLTITSPGTLRYAWNASDEMGYIKQPASRVGVFTPDLTWQVTSITDADGVAATPVPLDLAPSSAFDVRYGRLRLENTFGPETTDLIMPMQIEYWDGSAWVLNTDDSCWIYDTSTEAALSPGTLSSVVANTPISATLSSGLPASGKELRLAAPGTGNTGTETVQYQVPLWLRYDWDGDGLDDDNPEASATFGQYRGHDRVIYWREIRP